MPELTEVQTFFWVCTAMLLKVQQIPVTVFRYYHNLKGWHRNSKDKHVVTWSESPTQSPPGPGTLKYIPVYSESPVGHPQQQPLKKTAGHVVIASPNNLHSLQQGLTN
jgi:hypothetical protein